MFREHPYTIITVDDDTLFHKQINETLEQYHFNMMQLFSKELALETIQSNEIKIDFLILNIDMENSLELLQYVEKNTDIKIILLSSKDDLAQREEFFSKAILDFFLTEKKVEHIADDIANTIQLLDANNKETILIIDNSQELCKTLQNILLVRNYNVLTASTAKDGLELLKDYEISLLILDMNISDINSLDFLEGLRDMYLLNHFFVLALTDSNNSSGVRDALKNGAKDCLKKPFLYEEFILKTEILATSSRSKKTIINQSLEIEDNLKSIKELLDASIGGMFIFEKNICINCNHEAVSLLGVKSRDAICGKDISEIFPDVAENNKKNLLDDKINCSFEDTIIHDTISYDVTFKERNITIGTKLIKIVSLVDITDLKRKEKILAHQSKMASMGEMIGNIAHQWRQPLTAISIAASGMKLSYELGLEDKDEIIEELGNIVDNTKFLSATIESFQNFLKIDKRPVPFSLKETLQKTLAIIHANLVANNIQIVEDYKSDMKIDGIENELLQVFLNIINNASDVLQSLTKLKKERYIFITTYKTQDELIISIKDNANGISDEIMHNIFEPYFTTKHKSQGTGLGLYMSHQILEKMGGTIKVLNEHFTYQDKHYKGANFQVSLPLH